MVFARSIRAAADEHQCAGIDRRANDNTEYNTDYISDSNPDYRADSGTHGRAYGNFVAVFTSNIDADDTADSRTHSNVLLFGANFEHRILRGRHGRHMPHARRRVRGDGRSKFHHRRMWRRKLRVLLFLPEPCANDCDLRGRAHLF